MDYIANLVSFILGGIFVAVGLRGTIVLWFKAQKKRTMNQIDKHTEKMKKEFDDYTRERTNETMRRLHGIYR